jgi:glyoxylase-like metal-dependent hydrolase (beta-lactamase superfamily II)
MVFLLDPFRLDAARRPDIQGPGAASTHRRQQAARTQATDRNLSRSGAFLVDGPTLTLVDAAVAGAEGELLARVDRRGRKRTELATLLLTHAHPDHIGAARPLREAAGCRVAVHEAERRWVEDTRRRRGRDRCLASIGSSRGRCRSIAASATATPSTSARREPSGSSTCRGTRRGRRPRGGAA